MSDSYSSCEDKSDTQYKIELESSEESDYEKSNSKRKKCRKRKKRERGLYQWHEDDEIIVLEQLYEFSGKNASYSKAFYDRVKNRLSKRHVPMNEMSKKIDGLKKEYLENERRGKERDFKFSGRHQWQVFVLSKRIWGADQKNNNSNGVRGLKGFVEFLQEMEIDVNCLTPSCLEYLKKEWQVQLLVYIELLSKKSRFDAKLTELLCTTKSHPNSSTTEAFQTI